MLIFEHLRVFSSFDLRTKQADKKANVNLGNR